MHRFTYAPLVGHSMPSVRKFLYVGLKLILWVGGDETLLNTIDTSRGQPLGHNYAHFLGRTVFDAFGVPLTLINKFSIILKGS